MKVKVAYLSILRDATGIDEEVLDVSEGVTVGGLLSVLLDKYGDRMKPFLDPGMEMGQSIMMMLNGELLSPSDMGRVLPPDAEFLVGLPPFGG